MQLITLTTDYGLQDHYVAVLKSTLMQVCPDAHILDVSHGIKPFNIPHAELVVRQAYPHFPAGTIHLICVREYYQEVPEWLWVEQDGHFFLMPNHGLASMLFPEGAQNTCKVSLEANSHLWLFAAVLKNKMEEIPLEEWTQSEFELVSGLKLRPVMTKERLRGTVIYADHYGNVLTNIERAVYDQWINDAAFKIVLKRNEPLTEICTNYACVASGEPLAYWNESGYLAIAVHNGNAMELLNLEPNDVIDLLKVGL
jgi:S-adenosyl-L-methionine hydrolase (adenosine-forming)